MHLRPGPGSSGCTAQRKKFEEAPYLPRYSLRPPPSPSPATTELISRPCPRVSPRRPQGLPAAGTITVHRCLHDARAAAPTGFPTTMPPPPGASPPPRRRPEGLPVARATAATRDSPSTVPLP